MFLTAFDRLIKQQNSCKENIQGYAVAIATKATKRACYLTDNCSFTNNEKQACILSKEKAVNLMLNLHKSNSFSLKIAFKYAFLVPISKDMPLTAVTFNGF